MTFSPTGLAALLAADLPGEVRLERVKDGYGAYRDFTLRVLGQWHGFAVFPDYRAVRLRDENQHWLATGVTATVTPDELPELWVTDVDTVTEARVVGLGMNAPMARILSVDGLAGVTVGPGRVVVTVADDPFIAGEYLLDGTSGKLDVTPGAARAPGAALTAAGLSALVYGVVDPEELAIRGMGVVPGDAAGELRALFPRRHPFLFVDF